MHRIALGSSYIIAYDDVWHRIDVNGRILVLSPTQYRLCHLFLSDSIVRATDNIGEMIIISYRSHYDLEAGMELSHRTLTKHISNLNARLAAMGLLICTFHDGYVLSSISSRQQAR